MERESQVALVDERSAEREGAASRPGEVALRASTLAVAFIVVVAPLVIGAARPDHQLSMSFAAIGVFCLTAWTRIGHRLRFRWPLWAPALLAILGLFQLVPLPATWVAVLSPRADALFAFSLSDLGLYGPDAGHPLSVDPPSTVVATIHQLGFLAVAWAAAEVPRGYRRYVEWAIIYGAALVATIGFVQLAAGLSTIYGVYAPSNGVPLRGYFSTFVNNNTLASFLALGTLASLGHAAETDDSQTQRRVLTAAALSAAGVFFSASRGGQVALLAGLVCFALLAYFPGDDPSDSRRDRTRAMSRLGLLLGVVGLALAALLLPDWSRTAWHDLTTENKFGAWPAAVDYALSFPAVGSGRGTFGVTYPLFQSITMPGQVSHPENIFLQLFCEWGLVGGLIGLGGGVIGWLAVAKGPGRETRPRHWGLLAGLAAVGVGQLADFGLEAAGLSLPVAAAFGLCMTRLRRQRAARSGRGRRHLALAAAGVSVLVLAGVAWRGPSALAALPDRAVTAVAAAAGVPDAIEASAIAQVADHPADAFLALKVAQRLIEADDADTQRIMRWLNRVLFLAPNGGEAHLLAARVLSRRGRMAQAADEYRAAMEVLPWDMLPMIREVVTRFDRADLVVRAIAQTQEHRRALGNRLLASRPLPFALEAIRLLQAEAPHDASLSALRGRACLGLGDLACVEDCARELDAADRPLLAAVLRARVAFRQGHPAETREILEGTRALGTRDRDFLRAATELYRDLGDLPAARDCLDKLWALVALEPRQAASALAQRAGVELRLGDPKLAIQSYERAWRLDARPAYAAGLIAAAEKSGHPELARAVLGNGSPRAAHPSSNDPNVLEASETPD